MRFAFLGRVSTEDLQDPVASRQWQLSRAAALVAGCGCIVAEFFDVGQSRSARNRHRSAAGWTTGTVLAVLGNPRYTGYEVWNKQSKIEVLIDPHNVGLGVRTLMRWNPRAEWVSSPRMTHRAIVNVEEFERAQHAHAIRGVRRTYLLRGLLRCGLCGRCMEGAWNNGRANYRCHHPRTADSGLPGTVSVREDRLLPHLAALLFRVKIEPRQDVTPQNIQIPRDTGQQVAVCRRLGLTLRYDHLAQTLTLERRQGDIIVRLI